MNKQRQKEKIVKSIKNSTASKKLSSEDICAIADALIKAGFAEMKSFAEYVGGTIAGHSNYHGDTILSALYCAAEGKEIDYLKPLNITEYGYKEAIKAKQELQDEIARLTAENERLSKQLTDGKCVYLSDSETAEGCVQSPCPNYKTVEDILKENAELTRKARELETENARLKEEAEEQKSIAEHEHATQMDWFNTACEYKAENAALHARLEKAVILPMLQVVKGNRNPYELVYKNENGRVVVCKYRPWEKSKAKARIAELKGGEVE